MTWGYGGYGCNSVTHACQESIFWYLRCFCVCGDRRVAGWVRFTELPGDTYVGRAGFRLRQAIGERAPGLGDSVSSESSPAKKPDNKSDQLIRLPVRASTRIWALLKPHSAVEAFGTANMQMVLHVL